MCLPLCRQHSHFGSRGKQSTSFSDFSGPEFVTLMSWIEVSFLHPSSQELGAKMPMCPPLSHIPNSCWWNFSFHQRPGAVTCSPHQETPVNVMLPMARSPQIKSSGAKPSFQNCKESCPALTHGSVFRTVLWLLSSSNASPHGTSVFPFSDRSAVFLLSYRSRSNATTHPKISFLFFVSPL